MTVAVNIIKSYPEVRQVLTETLPFENANLECKRVRKPIKGKISTHRWTNWNAADMESQADDAA